jgi:PTS system N-acetylgalactosamine-specific IIA component
MSDAITDGGAQPVRALVAGHAGFAHGLVSAVEQITGRGGLLRPVSVTGLGAEDIERTLRGLMDETGARVIFTDLQAGSCSMAARRILRGVPEAVLICGANLPVLLDFVFADTVPAADAACHAAERGRAAISVQRAGA